jgi:predicted HTH domain antitoxin
MASVSVEMPEGVFSALHRTPEEFAREMRLAAAIHWYSRGEISQGRGAEIAGLSRREFLEALYRAEVPACQETIEELKEEVERDLQSRRERLAADPPGQGRPS